MTFNRKKALLPGHRLYTSVATWREWGAGGQYSTGHESYDSRGWLVPPKPSDVLWPDYGPRRIRPFRSPPRQPASYWLGFRTQGPALVTVVHLEGDGPKPEWLAERNAAGHATKREMKGTRIERILVEEKSPHIVTLRQMAELMRPPIVASNDNSSSDEEGDQKERGSGFERVHNQGAILPSIPVLLRAYADGLRPRVVTHPNGTMTKFAAGIRALKSFVEIGGKFDRQFFGLQFFEGQMTSYGDDKGRRRKPRYNTKVAEAVPDDESETAKHVEAQPEENKTYTRLKATGTYVSAQSPGAPRSLAPPPRTARASANDGILAKARANTKVMPMVKRLPDGVAAEYGRLAGVAEMRGAGDGRTSAPMPEALSEMERAENLKAAGIIKVDLDVIEDVLADVSFRTIGLQFGYAESSASRMGRKVVEDVLTRFSKKLA